MVGCKKCIYLWQRLKSSLLLLITPQRWASPGYFKSEYWAKRADSRLKQASAAASNLEQRVAHVNTSLALQPLQEFCGFGFADDD